MALGTAVQLMLAELAVIVVVVKPVGVPHKGGVVILKLVLLISKKIFPMASILILAVVVKLLGSITA